MNNLVDPVKVLLCGDHSVGKTSIARRLADMKFPDQYAATSGLNDLEFIAELKHSASIRVSLVDIGADLFIQQGACYLDILCADVDGVIIVVDGSRGNAAQEARDWLELLTRQTGPKVNKYIMVHKADVISLHALGPLDRMNDLVRRTGIEGWALTVGHEELGDLVLSRGFPSRQKAPADVLRALVLSILLKRQSNFCKLLPVPFKIEFTKWTTYDYEDLDRYIERTNMS